MGKANYYTEFGKKHRKPGFGAAILAFIIRVSPKLGPLKTLKFKEIGPQAEKLFIQSFDTVLVHYTSSLNSLGSGNINLMNIDFDTGNITTPGEYSPADKNYALLLLKLKDKNFLLLNYSLKQNILDFYAHSKTNIFPKKNTKAEIKITEALEKLRLHEPSNSN